MCACTCVEVTYVGVSFRTANRNSLTRTDSNWPFAGEDDQYTYEVTTGGNEEPPEEEKEEEEEEEEEEEIVIHRDPYL